MLEYIIKNIPEIPNWFKVDESKLPVEPIAPKDVSTLAYNPRDIRIIYIIIEGYGLEARKRFPELKDYFQEWEDYHQSIQLWKLAVKAATYFQWRAYYVTQMDRSLSNMYSSYDN